jgi:hypothetical protein
VSPFAGSDWVGVTGGRPGGTTLRQHWMSSGTEGFLARMLVLEGVPIHYLVPDDRLLPPESLRIAHVDPAWTARLIDGALAAGRVSSRELATDMPLDEAIDTALDALLRERTGARLEREPDDGRGDAEIRRPEISGFLLRSELVRRWSALEVEVWDDRSQLPLIRMERLAPDVLIGLVPGRIGALTLIEPYDGVRFGVELAGGGLRPVSGARAIATRAGRVLDVAAYATGGMGPAALAAELLARRQGRTFRVAEP